MLEHSLLVTTDHFEATTPKPNFINPNCFGEDLASWLQARLAQRGLTVSDPVQEDWGWVVLATVADRRFTISIGILDESIGQIPSTWHIGIAYEKPLNRISTWFKPAPVEGLQRLFDEVRSILSDEPAFKVSPEEF